MFTLVLRMQKLETGACTFEESGYRALDPMDSSLADLVHQYVHVFRYLGLGVLILDASKKNTTFPREVEATPVTISIYLSTRQIYACIRLRPRV